MQLCHIDAIEEDQSLGFEINEDLKGFVVKKDGEIYVYQNKCPHLGIDLEWKENEFLDMDAMFIQCSTHGALFEIDSGKCIAGPCQGDSLTPLEFEINGDHIEIREPK